MTCLAALALGATIAAAMYHDRVSVKIYWQDNCEGHSTWVTVTKSSLDPNDSDLTVSEIEQRIACDYPAVKSFQIDDSRFDDPSTCYTVPVCEDLFGIFW